MKKTPVVFLVITVITCLFLVCMVFISGSSLMSRRASDSSAGGFFAPFPVIDERPPQAPISIPPQCEPYLADTNIYSAFITEKSYTTFIEKKLIYDPFDKKHILYIRPGDDDRTEPAPDSRPVCDTPMQEKTRLLEYDLPSESPYPGSMPERRRFCRLLSPEGAVLYETCGRTPAVIRDIRRFSRDTWLILTDTAPNAIYVNTRSRVTVAYTALPIAGKAPDVRYLRAEKASILDENTLSFVCPGNARLKMQIRLTPDDVRKNLADKHDMGRQITEWNGKEPDSVDMFPHRRGRISVKDALGWKCATNSKLLEFLSHIPRQ
ncbi:MAG: hypothetical protein IK083_09350 [Abditibacteriota bacterium]|nr:hypothetical protein [Abditibacteriota bacterium]